MIIIHTYTIEVSVVEDNEFDMKNGDIAIVFKTETNINDNNEIVNGGYIRCYS